LRRDIERNPPFSDREGGKKQEEKINGNMFENLVKKKTI